MQHPGDGEDTQGLPLPIYDFSVKYISILHRYLFEHFSIWTLCLKLIFCFSIFSEGWLRKDFFHLLTTFYSNLDHLISDANFAPNNFYLFWTQSMIIYISLTEYTNLEMRKPKVIKHESRHHMMGFIMHRLTYLQSHDGSRICLQSELVINGQIPKKLCRY